MLFASVGAVIVRADDSDKHRQIQQLARTGRNAEAIQVFESLPDRDTAAISVLRAAAGCYWRERRFEEARALYRLVMERQSHLNTMKARERQSAAVTPEPPVVAPEPAAVTSEPAAVTPEPPVEVGEPHASVIEDASEADSAATADPVMPPAVIRELEVLKSQISALEAQREQQRREADARMADVMAAVAGRVDVLASSLEQAVSQLQVQLADKKANAVPRNRDGGDNNRSDASSLDLALAEIERLEQELATRDAVIATQQASLLQKIMELEVTVVKADAAQERVERELEVERHLRRELAVRLEKTTKQLDHTSAMLEKAQGVLASQYNALRENVWSGTSVRLAAEDPVEEANGQLASLASASAPETGRQEVAAIPAERALREQLARERELFLANLANKDADLTTLRQEVKRLQTRVSELSAKATAPGSHVDEWDAGRNDSADKGRHTEYNARIEMNEGDMSK